MRTHRERDGGGGTVFFVFPDVGFLRKLDEDSDVISPICCHHLPRDLTEDIHPETVGMSLPLRLPAWTPHTPASEIVETGKKEKK
ncbi:hypothetical protein JZ751_026020, partial [Albula glossodonta]